MWAWRASSLSACSMGVNAQMIATMTKHCARLHAAWLSARTCMQPRATSRTSCRRRQGAGCKQAERGCTFWVATCGVSGCKFVVKLHVLQLAVPGADNGVSSQPLTVCSCGYAQTRAIRAGMACQRHRHIHCITANALYPHATACSCERAVTKAGMLASNPLTTHLHDRKCARVLQSSTNASACWAVGQTIAKSADLLQRCILSEIPGETTGTACSVFLPHPTQCRSAACWHRPMRSATPVSYH